MIVMMIQNDRLMTGQSITGPVHPRMGAIAAFAATAASRPPCAHPTNATRSPIFTPVMLAASSCGSLSSAAGAVTGAAADLFVAVYRGPDVRRLRRPGRQEVAALSDDLHHGRAAHGTRAVRKVAPRRVGAEDRADFVW